MNTLDRARELRRLHADPELLLIVDVLGPHKVDLTGIPEGTRKLN